MSTQELHEEEFIEAQIAVVAVRLSVGGLLWCIALALLDHPANPSTDPYVANVRIWLWLFLAEILFGSFFVRYKAPTSFPLYKRAAFIVAESCTQAGRMAIYVAFNLVVRWLIVTLLTALAIYLFGQSYLTRLAAIIPSISSVVTSLYGISSMGMPPIIRGTHIGSYSEAVSRAARIVLEMRLAMMQRMLDKGFDRSELNDVQVLQYPFGGVMLPSVSLDPNHAFLGTVGTGKTILIRSLLKPALMPFGQLRNRALIYDGKREFLPALIGMGIPLSRLAILNPGDARCVAYELAKDVRTRDDAVNLVYILIPDDKNANENPFFIRAVRSIVTEVMMVLHTLSPGKWRLIDLINALRTPELMKRVLQVTEEGREVSARYFTDAKEAVGGIISTVDARFISEYETIARIWARCERSISLVEWLKGHSVLLLGFDANRQAVDRINQAIFQRASQLICSLPEAGPNNADHTWIVLDETRFIGKLPMLSELMSFGRTKNSHVVLGSQDIDGLVDVYGESRANEMLGLCGNVGILRLSSPKTRDWAAKFFGDYEAWESEKNHSISTGTSGGSYSRSETWGTSNRRVKRESVLPSDFFNLPPTNRQNGLHGYFATPCMGAWRAEIPTSFIDAHLPPSDPEAIPFIPRPDFAVDPVRWTKEEEERFTRPANGVNTAPGNQPGGAANPPADNAGDENTRDRDPEATDEDGGGGSGDDTGGGNGPLPNW